MGLKCSQNLVISSIKVINIERKFTLGQFWRTDKTVIGGFGCLEDWVTNFDFSYDEM